MDVAEDKSATYKLLKKQLRKMGYRSSEVFENDKLIVRFTSPSGRVWETSAAHITYPFNTRKIRDMSVNKDIAYNFVSSIGYSIPYTCSLLDGQNITNQEIGKLFKRYRKLVVKPVDSSLSQGLSMNITNHEGLRDAIGYARQTSSKILIQEQVEGEEVRFVALNSKVIATLLRRTPRVVGDGHSTIADLIKAENEVRRGLRFKYLSYPELTSKIIGRTFIESDDVPEEGETVELSHSTMIRKGCSVYNIYSQIHESYIDVVEDIVKKIAVKFIVVDMFIKDFTKPVRDNNYWFIEFNSAPVLKLFYGCRDGKMVDILPGLAKAIDEHIHKN